MSGGRGYVTRVVSGEYSVYEKGKKGNGKFLSFRDVDEGILDTPS